MQFKKIFEVAEVCRFSTWPPALIVDHFTTPRSETIRERPWYVHLAPHFSGTDKIEGNDLERVQDHYDLCTRVSDCLPPRPLRRYVPSPLRFLSLFLTCFASRTQRSMEDGDMIDAHLQQACTWLLSPLSMLISKTV